MEEKAMMIDEGLAPDPTEPPPGLPGTAQKPGFPGANPPFPQKSPGVRNANS